MDHSKESWKNKNTMVLTKARGGKYEQPTKVQIDQGKKRRALEDLRDEKALQDYVRDIWDD